MKKGQQPSSRSVLPGREAYKYKGQWDTARHHGHLYPGEKRTGQGEQVFIIPGSMTDGGFHPANLHSDQDAEYFHHPEQIPQAASQSVPS